MELVFSLCQVGVQCAMYHPTAYSAVVTRIVFDCFAFSMGHFLLPELFE